MKASVLLLLAFATVAAHALDSAADSDYTISSPFPASVSRKGPLGKWAGAGTAEFHKKGVALTTGSPNSRGLIWNSETVPFSSWQATFKLSVHGTFSEGDHGLAFWYRTDADTVGDFFGGKDFLKGLAIIFDSNDDDGNHNNPSVSAHLYDGTREFSHADDGIAHQLAGCVADYRNRNEPVTARITYRRLQKRLEVYLDMANRGRFQRCLVAEDVDMPRGYYFGFSAETLQRDDVHMIHSFKVTDLSTGQTGDESMKLAPPPSSAPVAAAAAAAAAAPAAAAPRKSPMASLKRQVDAGTAEIEVAHELHAKHEETRQHIAAHVASLHDKIDRSTAAMQAAAASATTTDAGLESKLSILLEELKRETDNTLHAYASHTNELMSKQQDSLNSASKNVEFIKGAVDNSMHQIEQTIAHTAEEVNQVQKTMVTSSQFQRLARDVASLRTLLENVQDANSGNGGGASNYLTWLLLAITLACCFAIMYQLSQIAGGGGGGGSRYSKII